MRSYLFIGGSNDGRRLSIQPDPPPTTIRLPIIQSLTGVPTLGAAGLVDEEYRRESLVDPATQKIHYVYVYGYGGALEYLIAGYRDFKGQ